MRLTPAWPNDPATAAGRRSPFFSRRGATIELKAPFIALLHLWRLHWTMAVSEICKGLVVVTIGDMVIADELGALLGSTAENLKSLGEFERFLRAVGRASKVGNGRVLPSRREACEVVKAQRAPLGPFWAFQRETDTKGIRIVSAKTQDAPRKQKIEILVFAAKLSWPLAAPARRRATRRGAEDAHDAEMR